MSQVVYSAYLDSVGKWSTLDNRQFLFLEGDTLTIQGVPDRAHRNPSNVLEQFTLDHRVQVVSKYPDVGFTRGNSPGTRKFQVRFPSQGIHAAFTHALAAHVSIQDRNVDDSSSVSQSAPIMVNNRQGPWIQELSASDFDTNSRSHAHAVQPSTQQPTDIPEWQSSPGRPTSQAQIVGPHGGQMHHEHSPVNVAEMSRSNYPPLKMPTPVVRPQVNVIASGDSAGNDRGGTTENNTLSEEELETMFVDFLKKDSNIELCKAMERIWIRAGMQP